MDGLAPYPEYRPSRLPWLSEIPGHWQESRAKFYYREVDERSTTGEEELLSVSHVTGVTPRSQKNVTMFKAESYQGHKVCRPGDLVINTMWAWMAALGVARHKGLVSPSYAVYRLHDSDAFVPEYADALMRTKPYQSEYICRSTGIRGSRLRLYPEKFLDIPIVRPPREEQVRIADYLNYNAALVSNFVRSRRRQLQLLNEHKREVIREIVTRGLSSSVLRKPSGIFWAPEIPAHWSICRIKHVLESLDNRRIPLSGTDRGAMRERNYDYYGASGVIDRVENYIFDDSLLLIAEDGANLVLRNLPLAIIARGKFWVNNHAHILKPRDGELEYFSNLLEIIDYKPWITGAAQPKLTLDRLMGIQIPVPPREEQSMLVQHIQEITADLTKSMSVVRKQIDLVREYRKRLTADLVTGRLDVRAAVLGPVEVVVEDVDHVEEDVEESLQAEEVAVGDE